MKKFFTAIIGGGFSGLCLAVMLGEKYHSDVVVIEGNKRVGKKILSTGNGQGNITNINMDSSFYHGNVEFAQKALSRYTNTDLLNFFTSLGLITCVRDGKVYPASFQAGSICDVLRFRLEDLGVTILTENYVTKVSKNKGVFEILCSNGNRIFADNAVLSFGGKSGAGFMTDGTSFALAKMLGHSITSLSPSLVQIKTKRDKLKGLKGVKQDAKVGLYSDKSHICTFSGDVLFTDYGVSGNAIFSLSAYLKGVKNPHLEIEFLPDVSKGELFEKLINKSVGITAERLLVSVLPTRLAQAVLREAEVDACANATGKNIQKILNVIKRFQLDVEGPAGFESSQVTAGGIDCNEVNPYTMESKITEGLYITGEALDVDGNCGGYNLQWAFTSAKIAGEALNGKD